jgi:hypothetical protein
MGLRSLIAVSVLVLAACDSSDPAQTAPGGARAEGEVLGGTISDEMIPLDQLRSQSPPLRPEPTGGATGTARTPAASEAADGDAAEEPAEETPEPADEPVAGDE